MNISIQPGFNWTEESLRAAISDRRKQERFSENELVESLLSLAAMLDSARENERSCDQDEDEDALAGISKCKSEERFSFFCGWDRLIVRYRESCANRGLQSAH